MNQARTQHVVFSLDKNLYGIPIRDVSEIIRMGNVQWIPNSRKELLGIIHLRDNVIPVISLHRMFAEKETDVHAKSRIIIVHSAGKAFGIVVDAVERVMFLPREHISLPPVFSEADCISGIYHVQEEIIALLDLNALLGQLAAQDPMP